MLRWRSRLRLQSGEWPRISVARTTLTKASTKLRRLELPETTTESTAILRLLWHTESATKTSTKSTVRLWAECAKAATIGRELLAESATESTTKHRGWCEASAEAASTAAISAAATTYAHV